MEDGNKHAILSRENPQSCLDCLVMNARTSGAGDPFLSEVPKKQIGKMAGARKEKGEVFLALVPVPSDGRRF